MKNRRKKPKDRESTKRRKALRIARRMEMPEAIRERMMKAII